MAEFPHLGEHCAHLECRQLDYLPMKCDGCLKSFCSKHFKYDDHECSSGIRSSIQVPVCPLCNQPVPVAKSEIADVVVGQHIDNDCQSDPARKKRAYVNRCSLKTCKGRELIPITCDKCRRNFCVKHRHFNDHSCTGRRQNPELRPLSSNSIKPAPPTGPLRKITSDEELARALQNAINSGQEHYNPEELDRQLAAQLQQEEFRPDSRTSSTRRQCSIS